MDSRTGAPTRTGTAPTPAHAGAWRFTVPPDDLSVPQIRHAVRDLLRRRAAPLSPDMLHNALLILSELVTNAVRHAALLTPRIGVEIALDGHWARLSVEDGHPYRPRALDVTPDQGTGGRGLLLVKTIAAETGGSCGVEPTAAGGKIVWAALPLDRL